MSFDFGFTEAVMMFMAFNFIYALTLLFVIKANSSKGVLNLVFQVGVSQLASTVCNANRNENCLIVAYFLK
jgi:hypothetical protein